MAQRMTIHRKLALILLGAALLLIGGVTHLAMARGMETGDAQAISIASANSKDLVNYDPLADPVTGPLLIQEIATLILKDIDTTADIQARLIKNLPQDAMALKIAVDAERARQAELREYQIAHGTVSTTSPLSLILPGLGLLGGAMYLRWRRKQKPRKNIWALKNKK